MAIYLSRLVGSDCKACDLCCPCDLGETLNLTLADLVFCTGLLSDGSAGRTYQITGWDDPNGLHMVTGTGECDSGAWSVTLGNVTYDYFEFGVYVATLSAAMMLSVSCYNGALTASLLAEITNAGSGSPSPGGFTGFFYFGHDMSLDDVHENECDDVGCNGFILPPSDTDRVAGTGGDALIEFP